MDSTVLVAGLIAGVSLLYAVAGQAGGTAFLAIMAFASFPATQMRPTALLLNIVAASYATWRLRQRIAVDWKLLSRVTVPSLVTAFGGGLLVLNRPAYFILTGLLLIAAAALMVFKRITDTVEAHPVRVLPAAAVGAGAGFLAGLTGVGGGVFLTPFLIALGWASPRRAAILSPPFILCNSIVGFAGAILAGQKLAPGTALYSAGALAGAAIGTAVSLHFVSERGIRYILAAILVLAGIWLLFP